MAIIRVRGRNEGIVKYLKTGQKSGRSQDRNEADERIFLRGNIEQLDSIIQSNHAPRKKYTHITISFKEDDFKLIPFSSILDFYEKHIFSAYKKDEYYIYAEAHIPKKKAT